MSLSNVMRGFVVALAVALCVASASQPKTGASGYGATQKNVVFYETKPKFEWPRQKGSTSRVVLWRVPNRGTGQRVAIYDLQNYTESVWSPADELDFETRYELYVYNDAQQIVSSWGFAIGYEPPKAQGPVAEANAKIHNLSPSIRITPFHYPYVYYQFDISESATFDKLVDSAFLPHEQSVHQFAGSDNQLNTDDDVKYVEWNVARVLKPNKTYYWRVRGYYFTKNEVAGGSKPNPANALGHSELIGEFTIPAQSGSDSLANITQITRDNVDTQYPTINKRLGLAYVARLPDIGSEIRVAGVTVKAGIPIFDTGREEFTKSVKGSWDMRPQWDVDGEGIFFDSDRSQQLFNIWYKRRDARGYTQLTFHNTDAWSPTVSKDGNRVAYQVKNSENNAGWSIWVVDRDGRSATELGAGEEPAFSPDGTKLAFSAADHSGNNQIWVMDTSGGNRVQITNEFNNHMPTWDPRGKRLVFVSNRAGADAKSGFGGNNDVWMAELEGARLVQLTNYLGDDTTPEFTPDGRYLLFASQRGGGDVHHIWMGEIQQ
jgi:hypothetical protein